MTILIKVAEEVYSRRMPPTDKNIESFVEDRKQKKADDGKTKESSENISVVSRMKMPRSVAVRTRSKIKLQSFGLAEFLTKGL